MRLAHIADIHVKDTRRDEYAAVFKALAAQLKAESPSLTAIVIAGDIFDTMSKASAHNWEDVASLFCLLADIAPLIIIPGNHDLNVRATNASSLITPMFKSGGGAQNLQPPQVTYWQSSGIREHLGAIWTVGIPGQIYPTIDEVKNLLETSPPETPLIGLYHESICDAIYANKFETTATDFNKQRLSELALAAGPTRPLAILLGDIHLQQSVPFPGSGTAAAAWYSGSLICQNFGEHHLGHGYLLWDLTINSASPSVKVTPRNVLNSQSPLTIQLGPDGEDITEDPRPENPYKYRIRHDPAAPPKLVADVTLLATQQYGFPPRNVMPIIHNTPPSDEIDSDTTTGATTGATTAAAAIVASEDWNQHEKLAQNILTKLLSLPSSDKIDSSTNNGAIAAAAIVKYRAAIISNLGSQGRAPRAKLIRLEFDDMFCYGPGNVVDFEALRAGRPGLVGFIAPNRAGKSSLFDIITFALCDEVPRGNKQDISRRGGPGYYRLRLTFQIDNINGRIEKTGYCNKASRPESTIRLWLGDDDLTADTITETAARASKLLGPRHWLNSVTFLRPSEISGITPFALTTSAKRREIISSLLNLGEFENLYKKAGIELAELRGARRVHLYNWPESANWKEGAIAPELEILSLKFNNLMSLAKDKVEAAELTLNEKKSAAKSAKALSTEASQFEAIAETLNAAALQMQDCAQTALTNANNAKLEAKNAETIAEQYKTIKEINIDIKDITASVEVERTKYEQSHINLLLYEPQLDKARAHLITCKENERIAQANIDTIHISVPSEDILSQAENNNTIILKDTITAEAALDTTLNLLDKARKASGRKCTQ